MTILRTQRDGCWELRSNTWGQFLAPTVDPDADTVITQEQLEGFELHLDIPKIPAGLWASWINLCIEMVRRGTGDLEVSCRLLRNHEGHYRICIPQQKVTGVSVRVESFDKAVDITTGEVIEQWPPEGWRPCGSSHSHNTMDAFFSGTDDRYELGDPGLHIVVGKIDVNTGEYTLKASVTANQRRFNIDAADVVELEDDGLQYPYAPECLAVIQITPSKVVRSASTLSAFSTPLLPDDRYNYYSPTESDTYELDGYVSQIKTLINSLSGYAARKGIDAEPALMKIEDLIWETNQFNNLNDPFYWNDFTSTY